MHLIVWIISLWTLCVWGQAERSVVSVRLSDEAAERPRLVELLARLVPSSEAGVVYTFDPGTGSYATGAEAEPLEPGHGVEVRVDANAWRRLDPDQFEPGPMNAFLGAVGLADAREILLSVDSAGDRLSIRWDRRREDPATTPPHELVLATKDLDGESEVERWEIEGLGIGAFVAGVFRIGLAIEPGEQKPNDRMFADNWLRGRGTLLSALDRATSRTEVVITQDLRSGLAFRFESAIRIVSVRNASRRIAPDGIAAIVIRGERIEPVYAIAEDSSGVVVLVAPTQSDLDGVMEALGLEADSGGDGP